MTPIKKFLSVGPGGMKCACCFPAPGKRKEKFRTAKRKAQRETSRFIAESVNSRENPDD